MNRLTKRILSVFLALAMIVTLVPPVTAEAATQTKKITLYAGEKVELPVYCSSITSVSSSKKTIAKAAKSGRRCIITAKKAGGTNITIQYKDYNNKKQKAVCKVTVKKPTFSYNIQKLNNGYVLVSVKNTSSDMFDRGVLSYSLKDTVSGEVVKADTTTIYKLLAGKTHYETIYVGSNYEIDCDGSSAKVSQVYRLYPEDKYKNIASNAVEYKELNVEKTDSQIKFDLKLKNTLNKDITVKYYVVAYDANDTIIDVPCKGTRSLGKKEVNTFAYNFVNISQYTQANYDHYKIVVQGCYQIK